MDSTFLRRHLRTHSNRRHSKLAHPDPNLALLSRLSPFLIISPDVSCGLAPISMWPETSFASVDPIPLLGVLQQCVFVFQVWISASCMRILPSPSASAFGLEPQKVRRSPLSAKRRGPRRHSDKSWWPSHRSSPWLDFLGHQHWRDIFACDTSSALEWCGLFMCAASSVVRVSFYSSCCTKTQRKYI